MTVQTANFVGALLLAALLSVAAESTLGNELQITPQLLTGLTYESNPRLSRQVEDEAQGLSADGRLDINYVGPRTSVRLAPRARFALYSDDEDEELEDEDIYLDLAANHRIGNQEFGLTAEFSDIAVRTSELATAEDADVGGAANLLFVDDSQLSRSAGASWAWRLNPTNTLRASANATNVNYRRLRTGRFDYDYAAGNLSWEHRLSEKVSAGVGVNLSEFESENRAALQTNDSKTYGGNVFINYDFSDTLRGQLYFGQRTTEVDANLGEEEQLLTPFGLATFCVNALNQPVALAPCEINSETDNSVGNASLTKTSERTRYTASVSRSITPSSNGTEAIQDELRLAVTQQLWRRTQINAGVLYRKLDRAGLTIDDDREFITANFGFRWSLTRHWSLFGRYRYNRIEYADNALSVNLDNTPENHAVLVGLTYRGKGWRFR